MSNGSYTVGLTDPVFHAVGLGQFVFGEEEIDERLMGLVRPSCPERAEEAKRPRKCRADAQTHMTTTYKRCRERRECSIAFLFRYSLREALSKVGLSKPKPTAFVISDSDDMVLESPTRSEYGSETSEDVENAPAIPDDTESGKSSTSSGRGSQAGTEYHQKHVFECWKKNKKDKDGGEAEEARTV
jgi:hypothetical protein